MLKRSKPQMIAVQARMAVLMPTLSKHGLSLVSLQAASKMNRRHAVHASNEAYTGVQPRPAAIGQAQQRHADWAAPMGSAKTNHDAPASMMKSH